MATGGDAKQRVQAPAIGLLAVGGINVLVALYNIFNGLFTTATSGAQVNQPGLTKDQQQTLAMVQGLSGTTAIISGILILIVAAVIIYGAMQMMKLKSHGLAMTSSILAMIPCISCCLFGLPIGIWSIMVISKPEVKSAFS
jgi:hypothetical protein